MKLHHLNKQNSQGLPLYPIRLTLDTVHASDIYDIHERLNIPLRMSGCCLYYNSEQEALTFMLAYCDN